MERKELSVILVAKLKILRKDNFKQINCSVGGALKTLTLSLGTPPHTHSPKRVSCVWY